MEPCEAAAMFFVKGANQYSKVLEMCGGQTGMGLGERANMQTSDSRAHIVAGMNKKAITVFSGLALTQSHHAY